MSGSLRDRCRAHLLAERCQAGHWIGELSTSALSTATASAALCEIDCARYRHLIRGGLDWIATHANPDGGYGDTLRSRSNINTTALCWAALNLAGRVGRGDDPRHARAAAGAEAWIARTVGAAQGLPPRRLVATILAFYGKDRTFSTPICSMLSLCGRLGARQDAFRLVPQLPFELAVLPQRLFRWLRLPVVSYAVPALVAIGQSRSHHAPSRWGFTRMLRRWARAPTLALVRRMQPENGGFLEAPPLPSFVALNLAASGQRSHPIVQHVAAFLQEVVRPDGSWPICTDLATFCTTLACNALAVDGTLHSELDARQRAHITAWLLAQQHRRVHPFTGAAPGGWGWSDRPGAIADADDTPGALLALHHLAGADAQVRAAASDGVRWLLDLQNADGGIPTFCRGWNRLPFDRSAADITAHTLAAWHAWRPHLAPALATRVAHALSRAVAYLERVQAADGSWLPLWFGDQWAEDDVNPTYGTARVLIALATTRSGTPTAWLRGAEWLLAQAHGDGSWGAGKGLPPSIEETALAVDALACVLASGAVASDGQRRYRQAIDAGVAWLDAATQGGTRFEPAPIGFYFAKLWYFERLYPVLFTMQALARVAQLDPDADASGDAASHGRRACVGAARGGLVGESFQGPAQGWSGALRSQVSGGGPS